MEQNDGFSVERAIKVFTEIDTNGDGSISCSEMADWLAKCPAWSSAHGISGVEDIFTGSLGRHGVITLLQFISWSKRLYIMDHGSSSGVEHLVNEPLGAYGAVRFLAHNRYLRDCLFEEHQKIIDQMQASDILTLEKSPEFFVLPEHSPRYIFADGTERGNFLTQIDSFVSPEEAHRIIQQGCHVKAQALGKDAKTSDEPKSEVRRLGSALYTGRSGTIAFDFAYAFGWSLLARVRKWLPVAITEGSRRWVLQGLNPRIRLVNYEDGNCFGMHFDARRWGLETAVDSNGLPVTELSKLNNADTEEVGQHTLLTLNLYLNDATDPDKTFGGGNIVCYQCKPGPGPHQWEDDEENLTKAENIVFGTPNNKMSFHNAESMGIVPVTGRMLVFGQGRLGGLAHEARPVIVHHDRLEDQKWILRADVTYTIESSNT